MIENIFPIPIYSNTVGNIEEIQKEMGSCVEKLQYEMTDKHRMYCNDHSYSSDVISDHKLEHFYKELGVHIIKYGDALGFSTGKYSALSNWKIDSSWIVVYKKGNYCQAHSHGFVDMAGIYYINTNGDDGNLYFISPRDSGIPSLARAMEYQPEVGKIMMWPGWLHHGVEENFTDNDRIALSFNITFPRSAFLAPIPE